jgi:iron complex outermembrane receptor protein
VKSGGVGGVNFGVPFQFDESGSVIHAKPALPEDGEAWPLDLASSQSVNIETKALRWRFGYDFGGAELTYLGGYRKLDFDAYIDLDGQQDGVGAFGENTVFAPQKETVETQSHELRLAGSSRLLDWQFGLYYFRETNDVLSRLSYYDAGPEPRIAFEFRYPDMGTESKAAFGQVGVHVTPELTVEGGVRYTQDEKWRAGYADYQVLGFRLDIDQFAEFKKWTYHGGVNYQASLTNLLYAKIDTGYKPGGYTDAAPYGPENITAYEIGSKNRFMDDKLQLNASIFYYSYTDQQVLQFVGSQSFIRNAGRSQYYGAELDAVALLSPRDRINADISYLHAEYKEFSIAVGAGNLDLAGNMPPQAPRWSGNVGYEHEFDVFEGSLTFRAQSHFQTKSHLMFFNHPSDKQPGYTRSDLLLTYKPSDEQWLIEGFVRNLENEVVLTAAQEQDLLQSYLYQFDAPRTWGVRFRMNW